jgi:hypothetical protein
MVLELFQGVVADRLQHGKPSLAVRLVAPAQKAVIDQRG